MNRVLLPEGWPRPKGYSTGIAATGELVFVAGQIVKAFVVLNPGHAASDALKAELQTHVKGVIAPYKYPRALEFVDALPKTQTGKLQRFRLKADA